MAELRSDDELDEAVMGLLSRKWGEIHETGNATLSVEDLGLALGESYERVRDAIERLTGSHAIRESSVYPGRYFKPS
jgi:hypothetical protein